MTGNSFGGDHRALSMTCSLLSGKRRKFRDVAAHHGRAISGGCGRASHEKKKPRISRYRRDR